MHKLLQHLFLVASLLIIAATPGLAQNKATELSVGPNAKLKTRFSVPLNLPTLFNYKTRAEILAMRKREIDKIPGLLKSPYEPYTPIWSAIEDGKPWWGLAGAGIFDSGKRSMTGPAEESRFVMNPYLLVAANPGAGGIWNPAAFTPKEMNDPAFPFFWLPESLEIDPTRPLGVVKYDITKWHQDCIATGKLRGRVSIKRFSLVAYNARDFGYNYIYFNPEKSINVINDIPTHDAAFIKQFIHCGGTCGCPTSCCNNMSPFMDEIDRLRITRLPARAVVYLWKESPADVQKSPDMVFLIEFH